jgi:hypothetical protein
MQLPIYSLRMQLVFARHPIIVIVIIRNVFDLVLAAVTLISLL